MESSRHALSLYVHVPFCASKCRYCDFYSVPCRRGGQERAQQARVVSETLRQAERFLDALEARSVESIYVGGGTPSVIEGDEFQKLIGFLSPLCPQEWTVEANPESLDAGFLGRCSREGVSRISVGIQSSKSGLLEILGRPGGNEDNLRAIGLLKESWKREVSLDFLAGIPGQKTEDLADDFSLLSDLTPGHISLYSLTVEPGTELHRLIRAGSIRPNTAEMDDELWLTGKRLLERMGYRNYEISNFALPGRECRHNLRYWRLEPYLGVGPGAVSTLPARVVEAVAGSAIPHGRDVTVMRISNPRDIGKFLLGPGELWGMELEAVSDRDFLLETLMMGLRTRYGIERAAFQRRFGFDFDALFPGLWNEWADEGLAESGADRLAFTQKGRLLLNRLLAAVEERVHSDKLPHLRVEWP